ncbi:MAG: flagellar biosynthetic protein FliR [Rickettsiales bacterium]
MLSQFLVTELFALAITFCRIGSAIMVLPGFGETYVSARVRLSFAIMVTLIVTPTLSNIPDIPTTILGLFVLIVGEILIGVFMGLIARVLISATHIAGTIIAMQSGLASALVQDVTQVSGQSSPISNLLGIAALVLLFATDLHHVLLVGIMDSYSLFTPGIFPIVGDLSNYATTAMNGTFQAAFKLAAPHIVIGLLLYLAAGVISRLVPNLQVFFLMLPAQIYIGFVIMALSFSSMMMWYMGYLGETFISFVAP